MVQIGAQDRHFFSLASFLQHHNLKVVDFGTEIVWELIKVLRYQIPFPTGSQPFATTTRWEIETCKVHSDFKLTLNQYFIN
jgi:hypothetical protein